MLLYFDPSIEQIEQICADSEQHAAKWIRAIGKLVCWRAEDASHDNIACMLHADGGERGVIAAGSLEMH